MSLERDAERDTFHWRSVGRLVGRSVVTCVTSDLNLSAAFGRNKKNIGVVGAKSYRYPFSMTLNGSKALLTPDSTASMANRNFTIFQEGFQGNLAASMANTAVIR